MPKQTWASPRACRRTMNPKDKPGGQWWAIWSGARRFAVVTVASGGGRADPVGESQPGPAGTGRATSRPWVIWPISVHGGTCGTTRARRVSAAAASAASTSFSRVGCGARLLICRGRRGRASRPRSHSRAGAGAVRRVRPAASQGSIAAGVPYGRRRDRWTDWTWAARAAGAGHHPIPAVRGAAGMRRRGRPEKRVQARSIAPQKKCTGLTLPTNCDRNSQHAVGLRQLTPEQRARRRRRRRRARVLGERDCGSTSFGPAEIVRRRPVGQRRQVRRWNSATGLRLQRDAPGARRRSLRIRSCVVDEVELDRRTPAAVRDRRGGQPSRRDVERYLPPVVHQRRVRQTDLADDLGPHVQGVPRRGPVLHPQGRPARRGSRRSSSDRLRGPTAALMLAVQRRARRHCQRLAVHESRIGVGVREHIRTMTGTSHSRTPSSGKAARHCGALRVACRLPLGAASGLQFHTGRVASK